MAKMKFVHAVMGAGKSTHLLQVRYNYTAYGKQVLVLTSSLDDRFGYGLVTSRIGGSAEAVAVSSKDDVRACVASFPGLSCVLVDEAQFLTCEQVEQLSDVADELDIPVVCYGLKTDVFGDLFEGASALLSLCDSIEEIRQLCFCNRKAVMNIRFDENGYVEREGSVVNIGDIGQYLPVCRHHFKTLSHRSEVDGFE